MRTHLLLHLAFLPRCPFFSPQNHLHLAILPISKLCCARYYVWVCVNEEHGDIIGTKPNINMKCVCIPLHRIEHTNTFAHANNVAWMHGLVVKTIEITKWILHSYIWWYFSWARKNVVRRQNMQCGAAMRTCVCVCVCAVHLFGRRVCVVANCLFQHM